MDKEKYQPVAKYLVETAAKLLESAEVDPTSGDYDQFTIYDEHDKIKDIFLAEEKKKVVDNIIATINNLDESDQVYLYGVLAQKEHEVDRQIIQNNGWKNYSVAREKMAYVCLREIRYHVRNKNDRTAEPKY